MGTDGLSRHRRTTSFQFVARKDQEEALRRFGYTKAVAIGHPIIYVPIPAVERLKNSLLVMPVHSIDTTEHQWDFDEYAEAILKISARFDRVVVCVSPSCFEKGYWVDAFRKRGFPVIAGANFRDKNAYSRMAALFRRFEFTTTNGFGSHLAYSQYFGSKASIYGPWPIYTHKDFDKDIFYLRCPEILDHYFNVPEKDLVQGQWPWLFCEPDSGIADQEWAGMQLGKDMQRKPEELVRLFEWGKKNVRRTVQVTVKSAVKRFLLRVSQLTMRISDPKVFLLQIKLAFRAPNSAGPTLKLEPGRRVLKITNPSQAIREYKIYHRGAIANVCTNPPEAPFLDLIAGDGIALEACRAHHRFRKFFYLKWCGDRDLENDEDGFRKTVDILPLPVLNCEEVIPVKSCCETVDLFLLYFGNNNDEKAGGRHFGVIRVRLCPRCQTDFFKGCLHLRGLSFILIEYLESKGTTLNPIITSLSTLGFSVDSKSIAFFPSSDYPELNSCITYVAAVRYGEAQRSLFCESNNQKAENKLLDESLKIC